MHSELKCNTHAMQLQIELQNRCNTNTRPIQYIHNTKTICMQMQYKCKYTCGTPTT